MCGRFTLWLQFGDLVKAFPEFEFTEELSPRYNIAPSQPVAVVPNDGSRRVRLFQWGLVPFWAKDPKIGYRLINARAETLAEKPAFRAAYRRRRCLILADGFYEWRTEPGRRLKAPFYVRLASGEPFAFAGLWEVWRPDDTPLYSCVIITTDSNALLTPIHDRMPVILPRDAYELWLSPHEMRPRDLVHLLRPYPSEEMVAYPVSRTVNDPTVDVPACIEPAQA